ncbi:exocyst complex component EXO70A1 [Canna indica]|uniref:Exocyst subunit Exo70 family protein n=1 Tax=Canna indica TaxID=4628 RepID=A0AAQ3QLU3_9LILI|nr:exocyst complex component EXO70A1 [Canna indica]
MGASDALTERAAFLRDSLQKSRAHTDRMVSMLGSFDHRLSTLEAAMRPTQVRTSAIRMAHENIDKTLKSADVILGYFERMREAELKLSRGPRDDLESYLTAIDQLRGILRFFSSNKSLRNNDGVVNQANNALAKAITRLEDEFRSLLTTHSKPVPPDSLFGSLPEISQPLSGSLDQQSESGTNHSEHQVKTSEPAALTPPKLIPPRILPLLHKLAQQLVQAGRQQQCFKIYREVRSSTLEKSLSSLGVEKLSRDEVQKLPWESLETKIGNWIHHMRIAVKLLFAWERELCNQIFEGIGSVMDQCFSEITANSMVVLLSFGEAIAKSKRSPEKLFVLLDMYEVMHELQPEIETIFEGKACSEMRDSALALTRHLAQTAQETFGDFEEAVEKDASKTFIADGTVHPLTSYVINYVKFLFDYQATLKQLFLEFGPGDGTSSQLATITMRIMQALQSNLDGKSKMYKDPALQFVFLMNNIHYIVKSVRRSEAKDILGDDWIQRHRRIVQQNANQYRRVAWAKILQTLSAQGLSSSGGSGVPGSEGGSSGLVPKPILKDRFKSFNMQFEDLCLRQCEWTVPDQELRESLRLAVAEILLPAYRSFLKRFGPLLENGKNPSKYIRYTPENLETKLGELFEGKSAAKATMEPRR